MTVTLLKRTLNMNQFLSLLITGLLYGQITFAQYNYPPTKTVDSSDTYWGRSIPDPYRWLENLKSPEVLNWFKAQAEYTNKQLGKISGQDRLIQELKDLDKIVSVNYSPISKAGGKYFYKKRENGEQVSKLYYKQSENGKEILLFDPQKYIEGKTMDYTADISDDGRKVLLNISEAGSELGDVRIIDVTSRKLLSDVIRHSEGKFAGGSNMEIIYQEAKSYDTHDPEIYLNVPCKLHVLSTSISSDIVIASSQPNPELHLLPLEIPNVSSYKNNPYIFLNKQTVARDLTLYYTLKSELKSNKINWKPLTDTSDEVRSFLVKGKDIYFLTAKGNSKFKIIKTNLDNPNLKTAETIFEGNNEWKISSMYALKDYLIINKSKNELVNEIFAYEFKTEKLSKLNIPLEGKITAFSLSENECLLSSRGWNKPSNLYQYNVSTKRLSDGLFHVIYNYPNLQNIIVEYIEVPSYDGAMVPLSIMYDKTKLKKDGSNICFMQGYGAYGSNYTPGFNSNYLPLLNRGVVMAYANVRGDGVKGNDWYLAGKKTTKPNTWKDFNACAEYLIKNKYTSSKRFGISGVSAGGILIGRAITERPDLYKVAIPEVGVLNVLRFEFSPNGPDNIPEFGTVNDSIEFKALLEMDAYQHIQKGVKYPAQLITTGFNDPRVESYFPAKFAAKMQVYNALDNPIFLYVDYKGGHYGGSTVVEQYAKTVKEFAFLLWQCGDKEFQMKK